MEKKFKPNVLNICMKEGTKPEEVLGKTSSTSRNAKPFEVRRIMDTKPVVEKAKAEQTARSKKSDDALFQEAYAKMTKEKKTLYRIYQVTVPEGTDIEALRNELARDPRIEFASLDNLLDLHAVPNDPDYSQLWAMKKIEAECAWDITQGDNVIVAVVDTGVDYNHPDLAGNMWQDPYSGDYGYDFSDGDNDPMDYHGHGTHVAGTIAAVMNNFQDVVGVAPKAKIMAIKIFPWAYESIIAPALMWAVDNGAKVLNNSWGYWGRYPSSPVLEAAIDYVYSMGGIAIFSAGNSGDETQYYSPQNYYRTMAIAATDSSDQVASWSNWGPGTDVAAPGVNILSLSPYGGTTMMSGTSMACPHVVGQAALLLSLNPSLTFEQVRDTITQTADPIVTARPIGSGRINLCNGLKIQTNCVAFTASGNSHVSQGADQQLVYPTAQTNEGNNWDGTQFIAPVAGLYHFALSFVRDALKNGGTLDDVRVLLMHNGTEIGKAWSAEGEGWAGGASYAATLLLAAGDTITTNVNSDLGRKRNVLYYSISGHLVCAA